MTLITQILLLSILLVALYHYRKNLEFRRNQEEKYNDRFIEAITKIFIHPPFERENDEDEYQVEDPILRKALGVDKKEVPDSKQVTVRTTIDLEDVYSYTEWTSANYSDKNCPSDCVMVYFKNGDNLLIFERYDIFQQYHTNYLKS
jgi:hypothetical protein